jgi:hypothetical protein
MDGLTNTQSRLVGGLLLFGGLAVWFESAIPDPLVPVVLGILGTGVVFLLAPAWVSGQVQNVWKRVQKS